MPHVRVFFEPLETGRSAIVGKQAIAVTQADGTFVLSTYGTGDGAERDRSGDPIVTQRQTPLATSPTASKPPEAARCKAGRSELATFW